MRDHSALQLLEFLVNFPTQADVSSKEENLISIVTKRGSVIANTSPLR